MIFFFFFFQAEDGIRDHCVTGVQTCALPIWGQGRCLLRGQELARRGRKQGAPPLVRGGRGDRGRRQPRGGDHNGELRRRDQIPHHGGGRRFYGGEHEPDRTRHGRGGRLYGGRVSGQQGCARGQTCRGGAGAGDQGVSPTA